MGPQFSTVCMIYMYHKFQNEEDDETQNWQRKAAMVLLSSGKERLLGALRDSIANGIPSLSRASLVTVSWISTHLQSLGDQSLQSAAFSILCPLLIQSLNHDKALEERVLASFTLLTLLKASGTFLLLLWIYCSGFTNLESSYYKNQNNNNNNFSARVRESLWVQVFHFFFFNFCHRWFGNNVSCHEQRADGAAPESISSDMGSERTYFNHRKQF